MNTPQKGSIRLGTSSWSSKGWLGPFYPKGTKAGDFLNVYSEQFDTVEVDSTYYHPPSRHVVEGWERKTPDGFKLSAKFPRAIVHAGQGPRPDGSKILLPEFADASTKQFLGSMSALGPKCGPLVLQFPYLNREAFAHRDLFLERLDRYAQGLPDNFRYGVEIRNKNWIDQTLLDFLKDRRMALVLVDLLYMPHPADLAKQFDLVTTDFTYCRLIGDRKAVDAKTKIFDKIVLDQSARLKRWAALLNDLRQRVPETYVYSNNHYAGHGPATTRELAELVGE
ncbi:MAG: hypothetical protein ACI8TQ_003785 [Planctomycetota bacterium]|jgi:uncharacterized protein YecE (DUF72 family)